MLFLYFLFYFISFFQKEIWVGCACYVFGLPPHVCLYTASFESLPSA